MNKLTGAEIVIECLKEQGVDTVFGYPGGTILNIYDALYKHQDEITHILTSHEQGAAHAADGYARATGKVGVCMATSGPGATNLVTGIATACMDSIPVVAITCNVAVSLLGRDSFQEIDIAGITMPITKYNFIVKDITKLADTIRRAFTIAQTGRPGPVLIDITKDVTANSCDYEYKAPEPIERQNSTITEEDMEKALYLIRNAKKPFIFAGGGAVIADAADELKSFAHKIQAPVADSLMGKGAFDGTDELYTGMVGMHGTKTSNFGITECDLLIVVGARFSDRVTGNAAKFAPNAKILQFDVDPAEIDKNVKTYASVIGDVKTILKKLNARLDPFNRSLCGGTDLRTDSGRCGHHDRGRPAPDVGRPVLQIQTSQNLCHIRGPWNHGLRPGCRAGCQDGMQRQGRYQYRRRRLLPYEHERDRNCDAL